MPDTPQYVPSAPQWSMVSVGTKLMAASRPLRYWDKPMVRGASAFGCRSLWASLVPMLTRGLNAKCRQRWCTGERAGLSSEAWWHYRLGPGFPERRVPMVSPEAMVGETHGALRPGGIAAWGVPADGCPGALPMVTFCSSLSPKTRMPSVPGEVPADGRSGALPMLTFCLS